MVNYQRVLNLIHSSERRVSKKRKATQSSNSSPELQSPQNPWSLPVPWNLDLELPGFNISIWRFPKLQNLHLELLKAWTSLFGFFHSFKVFIYLKVLGASNLQLNRCSFIFLSWVFCRSNLLYHLAPFLAWAAIVSSSCSFHFNLFDDHSIHHVYPLWCRQKGICLSTEI